MVFGAARYNAGDMRDLDLSAASALHSYGASSLNWFDGGE